MPKAIQQPRLFRRDLPLFSMPENAEERAENATVAAGAVTSAFGTVIIPLAALLMVNIGAYAALVSFAVRPNTGGRLLPVFGLYVLGIVLGGALQCRFPARRILLAAGPVTALAALLPGLQQYVFNDALRGVGNFTFGLALASAYRLFFSRFPAAWRGTVFGACLGAGLLCWNLLASLAHTGFAPNGEAFHPVLEPVFYIHAGAVAILAILCLAAPSAQQEAAAPQPYFVAVAENTDRRALIRVLLMAVTAVYALSGILDAKLTPMVSASPGKTIPVVLTLLAAVAAPFAGWVLDRHPERLFRHVLPVCCWLFVLAPSLAVLGYEHELHTVLQPVAAAAQFVFFVLASIAVAGLAPDAGTAAFHACLVYVIRLVLLPVNVVWTRAFAPESGTTILVATVLALIAGSLIRKARFGVTGSEVLPEPAQSMSDLNGNDENKESTPVALSESLSMDAFLASGMLTPRERETAELLLGGKSGREIAAALGISERTVKKHITNIYRKFGVGSRREFQRRFAESLSMASPFPENS